MLRRVVLRHAVAGMLRNDATRRAAPQRNATHSTRCERAITRRIGNESVPIQLAQCWFPGLAISNAKNINIFFK